MIFLLHHNDRQSFVSFCPLAVYLFPSSSSCQVLSVITFNAFDIGIAVQNFLDTKSSAGLNPTANGVLQ